MGRSAGNLLDGGGVALPSVGQVKDVGAALSADLENDGQYGENGGGHAEATGVSS